MEKIRKESSFIDKNPKKILFSFFLFFLFFLELMLRVFIPLHFIEKDYIMYNKFYFKSYKENSKFIKKPSKYDSDFKNVINKINSIGIRGPEINKKQNFRVLNIGDSYIQADEVDFKNTFGEKLNNNLNIEFISHGMPSWAPTPQFSWIYRNLENLSPDEINLFIYINDFFPIENKGAPGDEFYRSVANYSSEFIPESYNIERENRFKFFFKKLYIIKSLLIFKNHIWPNVNIINIDDINNNHNYDLMIQKTFYKSSDEWSNKQKINVLKLLDVIKNMNNFLLKNNVKLNVLFVPNHFYWKDELFKYRKIYDEFDFKLDYKLGIEPFIKEYLLNKNISYIDLTEKFIDYKKNHETKLFFEWDGHFNNNGHELIFQILKEHYKSKNQITNLD